MTNNEKILEFLRDNPKATDQEIAEAVGILSNSVPIYIGRLKDKGWLEVQKDGKLRTILVAKELPISKNVYKKEIIETMIAKYMEDFEDCGTLNDRIEVGKVILKLLEKL